MTRIVIPETPGAATIRQLRAELQSVLEREAATHARHDARVEALEAQIAVQPAPVTVEEAARVLLEQIQEDAVFGQQAWLIRTIMGASDGLEGSEAVAAALCALAGEKPNE